MITLLFSLHVFLIPSMFIKIVEKFPIVHLFDTAQAIGHKLFYSQQESSLHSLFHLARLFDTKE